MAPELAALSRLIAGVVREVLPNPRRPREAAATKADGSWITEADRRLQERIRDVLAQRWPEDGFLAEEMPPRVQQQALRHASGRLWCLDPLDGTTNFAAGLPYFGVSLALLGPDGPELALVYDPLRDECFTAARGGGAYLNGTALPPVTEVALARAIGCVDFKRLPRALAVRLACEAPYHAQRSFGACALDWCWLAAGRFHLYLHGGQRLWDHAAGGLVLAEAGGRSATLEGEPVFARTLAPRSVVAAAAPGLYAAWRAWLCAGGV